MTTPPHPLTGVLGHALTTLTSASQRAVRALTEPQSALSDEARLRLADVTLQAQHFAEARREPQPDDLKNWMFWTQAVVAVVPQDHALAGEFVGFLEAFKTHVAEAAREAQSPEVVQDARKQICLAASQMLLGYRLTETAGSYRRALHARACFDMLAAHPDRPRALRRDLEALCRELYRELHDGQSSVSSTSLGWLDTAAALLAWNAASEDAPASERARTRAVQPDDHVKFWHANLGTREAPAPDGRLRRAVNTTALYELNPTMQDGLRCAWAMLALHRLRETRATFWARDVLFGQTEELREASRMQTGTFLSVDEQRRAVCGNDETLGKAWDALGRVLNARGWMFSAVWMVQQGEAVLTLVLAPLASRPDDAA